MRLVALAWREFAGASRRPSTWWMRIVYLAAVGAFVLAATGSPDRYFSIMLSLRSVGEPVVFGASLPATNRSEFIRFVGAQAAVLGVLALVLVHAELSRERTRRTLDLLLTTEARPLEIVLGKVAGVWGRLLVLFLCGLAVMLALLSRGGISGKDILAVSALTGAVVALNSGFAAVGGSLSCLPLTLFLAFAYYLLPSVSTRHLMMTHTMRSWVGPVYDAYAPLHFLELADPTGTAWSGVLTRRGLALALPRESPFFASGMTLAPCLFLLLVAARVLSRPGMALSGWAAAFVRGYDAFLRRLNAAFAGRVEFDPSQRFLWTRPFLWRESRRSVFSRFENRARLGAAAAGVWMVVGVAGAMGGGYGLMYRSRLVLVGLILASGLATGLAAVGSLAGDLERSRLDVLLASPRRGLMPAKMTSSAWLIAPLSLAALVVGHMIAFVYDMPLTWPLWLGGLAASTCGFSAGVGFLSAALLRSAGKASVAVIAALGGWAVVGADPWLVLGSPSGRHVALIVAGVAVWFFGSLAAGWLLGRRRT